MNPLADALSSVSSHAPRPSLLSELKRRRVLRVLGIYLVGFWLLLQIVDVVGPALQLPDWTLRALLIAGGIGLPIAIMLAWIYDFSRHGVMRTPDSLPTIATTQHGEEKRPKSAKAYELYLRANQLSVQTGQWGRARDMYLEALQHDAEYAPAWARLGRCYRLLGKYAPEKDTTKNELKRAEEAFDRALELDAELSITHSMYAQLEIDLGRAEEAMVRLLARGSVAGVDAELLAGLVQACRFCGLLDASIAAYERARELDPHVRTSVAHTYFMQGRYQDALAEYNNADIGYLEGLALAMLGREGEAIALLTAREGTPNNTLVAPYLGSLRATLQGRVEEAVELTKEALSPRGIGRDGEAVFYMARQYARLAVTDNALALLTEAVDGGFFCAPIFADDPWLDSVRPAEAFKALTVRVNSRHRQALTAYNQTGGAALLGPVQPSQSSSLMPSGSLKAT